MRKNFAFIILGTLAGLNFLAWIGVFQLNQSLLEVSFFDVGQGDSIFIETPQGHQILIDGGPDDKVLEKLGKEMPFWDRTIDLVILSHPEKDHLAGLLEVLKRYRVENILWTGVVRDTAEYKEWVKLIKEEGADIAIARANQRTVLCNLPRTVLCYLDIIYPVESLGGKIIKDSNNTSIFAKLVFGETSFLFTGDAPQSVEKQLLGKAEQLLDSDVLKAGHHGSKTAGAEEFIKAVSPKIAVISLGKNNSYGHPHRETLAVLEKYDINVLRTDIYGDIKIISNGYEFSTF